MTFKHWFSFAMAFVASSCNEVPSAAPCDAAPRDMMEPDAAPPSNAAATFEHTSTVVTAWENLAVSPDASVVLRYTAQQMHRSHDGGRTWTDFASGVGHIAAVAARDDGSVFVVRHEADTATLYVRDERELRARALPCVGQRDTLIDTGRTLVWLCDRNEEMSDARIGVSHDNGRTWQMSAAPDSGNAGYVLTAGEHGALWLLVGHESRCGGGYQLLWRGHIDGRPWETVPRAIDAHVHYAVGVDGWRYAPSGCGPDGARALCAVDDEVSQMLAVLDDGDERALAVVTDHAHTVAVLGASLLSLAGGRAHTLTRDVPRGFVVRGLTRHGDVYGLVDGAVTRWRAADGWHTL